MEGHAGTGQARTVAAAGTGTGRRPAHQSRDGVAGTRLATLLLGLVLAVLAPALLVGGAAVWQTSARAGAEARNRLDDMV